jgi:DNA-binding NarL/FixJ family response regulator
VDVVILDLHLPDRPGLDVLAQIARSRQRCPC